MEKIKRLLCAITAFTLIAIPMVMFFTDAGLSPANNSVFAINRQSHVHSGNHYLAKEPTCEEPGSREYWVCCGCHETFLADETEEIANGIWTETGTTGDFGVGGVSSKAYLAPLGHEHGSIVSFNETTHTYICDCCGKEIEEEHNLVHVDAVDPTCISAGHNAYDYCTVCDYSTYVEIPATGVHEYQTTVVQPNGVRRGYTLHSCEHCDDYFYDNFDFSLYQGVTFAANTNKHLIPYYFNSNYLTIEASLHLAPSYSGRGGVIVGSYGISDCLNVEINSSGQIRVYAAVNGTNYDMHFDRDVRSNGIVNIALTFVSSDSVSLYIDGSLVETKTISYALPEIGRKLTIGGDNRSNNAQYFKGTLYTLSIFKDIRTANEIVSDIILANANDSDCCVSYNLIDSSYLSNENDPTDDPYVYAEVDSLEELEYHCSIGTNFINVTSDIVLDRTIYAIGDVTIYANDDYSIIRDPDFSGDMFVFGENEYGRNLILDDVDCNITFGKADATGTLTIDGNKNNLNENVSVDGSIVYISYSASFTLVDNAVLTNNKKVGNSRTFSNGHDSINRIIGGAAVTIYSGAFNMNGGSITNCEVNDIDISGGDDTSDDYRLSTNGGAIFNYGNFNMNGGTISSNRGFYGGALANYGVAYINAGTISDNSTSYAGGAIYMVGASHAQMYIGNNTSDDEVYNVIFQNNSTNSMGGAIYAGVWCNTMIYGSTKFEGNHASGRGGAVSSNGFFEIKSNTLFKDNYSSNKGGALSIFYDENSELSRRECALTGVSFTNNRGTGGGAVYANGADVDITSCSFINNNASSNHGGAIYIDPTDGGIGADIDFSDCSFTSNVANTEAGAIFIDSRCDVAISGSTFSSNVCSTNGGAISAHGVNSLNIDDSTFDGNNSASGGALYLSVRTITNNNVSTVYDSTCTVYNSTFENNLATTNGGAVYMFTNQDGHKTAIFTNCEFNSNRAYLETEENNTVTKSGKGGAIYANNSDFDVIGSSFDENIAGGNGGAIYTYNSTATLSGISANDNVAYGNGGFVCVDSSSGVTSALVLTNNSIIQGNSAVYGGAIQIATATSSANISDTTFVSNTSLNNGGAIYVNYGSLACDNCEFDDNIANSASYGGGAIYGTNATITVSNTSFDGNSAKNGGAICGNTNSVITLTNVSGTNNAANAQGGFAYVNGGAQLSIVTANSGTSTLSGNTAVSGGGAIYVTPTGTLLLTNVTLSNNSCSNASGGALYLYCGSTTTITNCYFTLNTASNGGAIISYGASFNVSGTTFTSNTASDWGGAIYIRKGPNDEIPDVSISGTSVFSSNSAANGGAMYINANTSTTITNTAFSNNAATSQGGAICFYASNSALESQNRITSSFTNVNFSGNSAANGGAVYANNVVLTINGGTYSGNSTTGDGGIMYIKYSSIDILNGTFTGNTSSGNGNFYINRSIFTTNSNGQGDVIFGTIVASEKDAKGNTAQNGGVIYATVGAQVNLNHTTFGYNSALASNSYGGAIHASGADSGSSTFIISNCTFIGNSGPNYGGAVGASISASVTISNSTFESNTGKYGGAVAANNNAVVNIDDSLFNSNSATTYGGAIWCTGATIVEIDGSTFTSNSSPNYGAIGCGGSSSLTITNSTFTSNSATSTTADNGNGGAIGAIATSTLVVDGCHFNSNSASSTGNGGAVYSITTSVDGASVSNSDFDGNSAKYGGAIAVNLGSAVELTSCTFNNNTANNNGGAIYVYGASSLSAEDCDFTNCSAASGGAIAVNEGGNVELTSCIFDTDNATGNGGAIYVYGASSITANSCEFSNCSAASGGAMRIGSSETDASVSEFTNCTFTSNSATGNGGAVYLYTSNANMHTFSGCTFTSNSAGSSKNGGAFYISGASRITLENTTMRNNTATNGSAIYLTSKNSSNSTAMIISGAYTSLNNDINVATTYTSVTINSSGLVSEDNPVKTWPDIVKNKTSVVNYI